MGERVYNIRLCDTFVDYEKACDKEQTQIYNR